MKNLNSKLLKEVLLDDSWQDNQDIIDLLVKKGATIPLEDHCKFLKMESNKFKAIVKYFNFDGHATQFPLYYHIYNLNASDKKNDKINENLAVLLKSDKPSLFKQECIFTDYDKKSYSDILKTILEEDHYLLLSKLIDQSVLSQSDFIEHKEKILYSLGVSFLKKETSNDDLKGMKCLELVLNTKFLDNQDISDTLLSRIGTSYLIYSGNKNTTSTALYGILNDITEDLDRIEQLGLQDFFAKESALKNTAFSKLENLILKELDKKMVFIRDLRQSDGIYTKTIKEFIDIGDHILSFEEKRKKFNLSKETFCLDKIINRYKTVIDELSLHKGKFSDKGVEVHEQKMNDLISSIRATIFDGQLKQATPTSQNIKVKI